MVRRPGLEQTRLTCQSLKFRDPHVTQLSPKKLAIGLDVGSTTVKAVVCDPDSLEILWSDYQRRIAERPR